MSKHTIDISQRPARLSLRSKQLILHLEKGEERRFACEDIGVLVLQHPAISISAAALDALLGEGAVVVICNDKHLPSGLLLPTIKHTELVPRMMAQLQSSQPARKQAWKQIVQAKLRAQANLLDQPAQGRILHLSEQVKSGDSENHEAQAAQIYWQALFPDRYAMDDKRDPASQSLFNSLLNYGYALIRATTARALVSAGLQPALGVFHHRRNNPFCLADDVMEPLRPLVDREVRTIFDAFHAPQSPPSHMTAEYKQRMLQLLHTPLYWHDNPSPLLAILPHYIASFYRLLTKESDTLQVPTF